MHAPEKLEASLINTPQLRSAKSGRVVSDKPYSVFVQRTESNGTIKFYEYPTGSKIYYDENLQLNREKSAKGLAKLEEAHKRHIDAQLEANKTPEQKHKDALEVARKLIADEELKLKVERANAQKGA